MRRTDLDDVRVLSVRQPWATLIVYGIKTIESRSWRTGWRGTLLIHACRGLGPAGAAALRRHLAVLADELTSDQWTRAHDAGLGQSTASGGSLEATPFMCVRGAVIGAAQLADVIPAADALTRFTDQIPLADASGWGWVLENPVALPTPVSYRGGQGLRRAEPTLLAAVALS